VSFTRSGFWTAAALVFGACRADRPAADPPQPPAPPAVPATPKAPPPTASNPAPAGLRPPAGFVAVPVPAGPAFRALVRELGPDRLTLLAKLNRVDLAHTRVGDTLVLPADSALSELDLAPLPQHLAALDSVPKLLVVAQRVQVFAAYEWGRLVYWGPTSTGKRATPTPNGLFFTNWKAKKTRSTENAAWILYWYFNIENRRGVSLHQYDLPGYPASHACVRLLYDDAEWIYRWADQWRVDRGQVVENSGTPVIVFGTYRYDSLPPWRRLRIDPAAATVTEAEFGPVLATHRSRLGLAPPNR